MQPSFLEVAPETRKEKISRVAVYLLFNKLLKTPIGRRQHYYGCERKTNYNLLWSNAFSNQIKDMKNTFYVGNPLLDKFATKKVNIEVTNPFALICTQPYDKLVDMGILKSHQALEMITMLTQIVIQNPDVYFYIKVHPSEDETKYEDLFEGIDTDNFQIRKDIPISELLKLVDVQVSMASYTSFEAVVAGVPIIIIHPEFINFFDQFNGEVELRADCVECFNIDLQTALRPWYRQTFSAARKEYLNKKLSYFGCSAETTANTIKKVVEWKKPGFK
jgi:capsule polysaccharide export protein KpsC/LpsZ